MSTTVTAETLLERVAERMYPRQRVKVTCTGGSTTTAVASSLVYSSADANEFDGCHVLVLDTTDDLAPKGEVSAVTRGGFAGTTGTLTLSPAVTALASGDTILLLRGVHPDEILDAANDIIRNLRLPRFLPWGANADGDMEATGVTAWTDIGTPSSTSSKETSNPLVGTRTLTFTTDTVDEGSANSSLPVTEGEELLLSCLLKVPTGSLRVQLYDVTNGAEIDGTTVDQADWTEVRFTASVPNDCEQVAIRFLSKTAVTTPYVNYAVIQPREMDILDLSGSTPLGDLDAVDIIGLYYQSRGYASEADDSYKGFTRHLVRLPDNGALRDYEAVNSHWPMVHPRCIDPIWIYFRETGTPMTTLTDTSVIPEEVLVAGTLGVLQERGIFTDTLKNWTRIYRAMVRERGLLDLLPDRQGTGRIRVPTRT